MKKSITMLLAGAFVALASLSNAQQFWIENWTGSTAQGQLTYTGPNGAWSVSPSGTNGADSNVWYFSNMEGGEGRGVCGNGGGNATAHMGFTANAPCPAIQLFYSAPDQGAVIDDDGPDPTNTNQRLQSPIINCTGKSNITLSFNYIMGNAGGNDYATVVYSANGGSTWSLLASPIPTPNSCSPQGTWTYYSVALPASANNNANVKIGFNWTNNMSEVDDSVFDNTFSPVVSFAVDSIVLKTPSAAPVAKFGESDTLICVGDTVMFTDSSTNSPTSWKWYFQNGNPATSTFQNQAVIYNTAGYDSVKLVVKNSSGSDSITVKKCIHVLSHPLATIVGIDTICKNDTDVLTGGGGGTYIWSTGATTSTVKVVPLTNTTYTLTVSNGVCSTVDSFKVAVKNCSSGVADVIENNTISIYPNPANNTINLEFANAISSAAKVEVTDITGRLISTQLLNASAGKIMSMDISAMASGMYIVRVTAGSNVYFDKFIKQ